MEVRTAPMAEPSSVSVLTASRMVSSWRSPGWCNTLAVASLTAQGIDEQLGRLGPVDGGVGPGGDAFSQADGLGQIQIAVRPDRPDLVAGVAQHSNQDGDCLGVGELGIRQEAAVPDSGDEGVPAGLGSESEPVPEEEPPSSSMVEAARFT